MIQKLNELLNALNINNVICEEGVSRILQNSYNFRNVKDVRSATFEALGLSKMIDDRVALLVDERYISSVYTGITEAWFQRTNILVVTFNGNLYQSLEYFDRCIVGKSMLFASSKIEALANTIRLHNGPFLLRTSINLDYDKPVDYSSVMGMINSAISENDTVFFYNPIDYSIDYKDNVRVIKPEHKYCVVSKYLGFILGRTDCKCILCIPESLLAYDSNIFNFRCIPNNFCIIIVADMSGLIESIGSWITSNNISLNNVDTTALSFSGRKEILYIKNK